MIKISEHQKNLRQLRNRYKSFLNEKLSLDMTRGKPCSEQLSLSDVMLNNLSKEDVITGTDYRNYTTPALMNGIDELRALFATILDIEKQSIIIGGNSSLQLMYDVIIKSIVHKLPGQKSNWSHQGPIKFLCPVPGYDRHFEICESFGINMIPIPLTGTGPDMDQVETIVAKDKSVKGIWCVPKYSNPTGESYSDETVQRLSSMQTAADDFRIMWDNAYSLHDLYTDKTAKIKNILKECEKNGNPDRVFYFASTSKITYAGGGVAIIAANKANKNWYESHLKLQTIGYDKINQLRHLKFLSNKETVLTHMENHASILKPKFSAVDEILKRELGEDKVFGSWTKPRGGYFISFNAPHGSAKSIIQMTGEAGVKLTSAGSTYPYKNDPHNCNIRIAPSLPSIEELKKATEVLAVVTKIITLENLL